MFRTVAIVYCLGETLVNFVVSLVQTVSENEQPDCDMKASYSSECCMYPWLAVCRVDMKK